MLRSRLERHGSEVLRFLEEDSALCLAALDRNLSIVQWNQGFQKLLDLSPETAGRSFADLVSEASREEFQRLVQEPGAPMTGEIELLLTGGLGVRMKIEVMPDCEGYLLVGQARPLGETEALREMTLLNNELANTARELHRKNMALERARAEIKTLKGLLPICSFCKKIRDDQGYWKGLETYISSRTEADFTHSICEECMKEHYPKYYKPKQ